MCRDNKSHGFRYELSCTKTDKDIESYEMDCGRDEITPYGKIILTNESDGDSERVKVTVKYEHLEGDDTELADDPFTWYDAEGNEIGKGGSIEVEENGDYSVEVAVKAGEEDRNLKAVITIDNVKAPDTEEPDNGSDKDDGDKDDGKDDTDKDDDGKDDGDKDDTDKDDGNKDDDKNDTDKDDGDKDNTDKDDTGKDDGDKDDDKDDGGKDHGDDASDKNDTDHNDRDDDGDDKNDSEDDDDGDSILDLIVDLIIKPSPTPAADADSVSKPSPTPGKKPAIGKPDDGGRGIGGVLFDGVQRKDSDRPKASPSPSMTPSPSPALSIETRTVIPDDRLGEGEMTAQIRAVKPQVGFFKSPVVRLITITAGSLAAVGGALLLLYLLRWSVSVYNDDGNGRLIYLGRCGVKTQEDDYVIDITDKMAEKAVTNRYCIRPGLFRIFRGDGQELAVCRGSKRVSAYLSKEMIVVI